MGICAEIVAYAEFVLIVVVGLLFVVICLSKNRPYMPYVDEMSCALFSGFYIENR